MADARPQLQVRSGLNVWRLLRTDRDITEAKAIPQHAAAAVRYFLGKGLSPEANHQLVPISPNVWRFDNVLPLEVLEVSRQAGPAMPDGELLADRLNASPDTVPTVAARKPWWVLLRFWWRGPPESIDYPGVKMGLAWPRWELNGADWVLDRAVYVPATAPAAPPDPGGATWTEALGDKAQAAFLKSTEGLGDLLGDLGKGFVLLLVLYALSQSRR